MVIVRKKKPTKPSKDNVKLDFDKIFEIDSEVQQLIAKYPRLGISKFGQKVVARIKVLSYVYSQEIPKDKNHWESNLKHIQNFLKKSKGKLEGIPCFIRLTDSRELEFYYSLPESRRICDKCDEYHINSDTCGLSDEEYYFNSEGDLYTIYFDCRIIYSSNSSGSLIKGRKLATRNYKSLKWSRAEKKEKENFRLDTGDLIEYRGIVRKILTYTVKVKAGGPKTAKEMIQEAIDSGQYETSEPEIQHEIVGIFNAETRILKAMTKGTMN